MKWTLQNENGRQKNNKKLHIIFMFCRTQQEWVASYGASYNIISRARASIGGGRGGRVPPPPPLFRVGDSIGIVPPMFYFRKMARHIA